MVCEGQRAGAGGVPWAAMARRRRRSGGNRSLDGRRCHRGTNDEASDIGDGRPPARDFPRGLVDGIGHGFPNDDRGFLTGDILDLLDTDRPALPSSSARILAQ